MLTILNKMYVTLLRLYWSFLIFNMQIFKEKSIKLIIIDWKIYNFDLLLVNEMINKIILLLDDAIRWLKNKNEWEVFRFLSWRMDKMLMMCGPPAMTHRESNNFTTKIESIVPVMFHVIVFNLFLKYFQFANTRRCHLVLVCHQWSIEMNCKRKENN